MKHDAYWLPVTERKAAMAYCQQYFSLKSRYLAMDGRRGVSYDKDPGGGGISDPTMQVAEKRARLSRKIEIIENACRWASPAMYPYLLLYVADPKTNFDQLQAKGFPLSRNHLSMLARKVYWRVSQRI